MSHLFKRIIVILTGVFIVLLILINIFQSDDDVIDMTVLKNELGLEQSTTLSREGSSQNISFPSADGEVSSRNFLLDPDVVDWDGGSTYMLGSGIVNQDEAYQIFYYEPDKSISIVLLQEPFAKIRLVAEQQLLSRLGISEKQACQMNTRVNIPLFASESLSGMNLGLSFCSGSVEL